MHHAPNHHRGGIGRVMLTEAETWLTARDIEYLQVKTLSPRHTRTPATSTPGRSASPVASGPLEEFPQLWGPDQPALQMIKTIPGR